MCDCKVFDKWVEGNRNDSRFQPMEEVKFENWCYLVQCKECNQLWQVDAWDKGIVSLAIKYNDVVSNWSSVSNKEIRIEMIIKNRGGLSDTKCQFSDCNNYALIGMNFCPICAYEKMGIRW